VGRETEEGRRKTGEVRRGMEGWNSGMMEGSKTENGVAECWGDGRGMMEEGGWNDGVMEDMGCEM
jgi:hypothetical protein